MSGLQISFVDAFLLAILPVAAMLLGVGLVMLRHRRAAQLEALANLGRERDRVRNALEGSSLTIWDWDIATDTIWLNSNWQEMLGAHPEEKHGPMTELLARVHPDDLERVQAAAIDMLKGITTHFDAEYRVRAVSGAWLWIGTRGKVTVRDSGGRALRASGSNADITARKLAERRLRESESQLRQLVAFMPAAIAFVNQDRRVVVHNKAYAELIDKRSDEIDGRLVSGLLGEERNALDEPHLLRALEGEPAHYTTRSRGPGGRILDFNMLHWPLRGSDGRVEGVIVLGMDVTSLKEADRMKDHFVSVVSHELRTPLTAMRGSLGLLAGGVVGELPAEAKSLVDIALQNSDRLWRLVNDLLDIEKMSAGHVEFRAETIAWRAMLRDAVDSSRGLMKEFDVSFELEPVEEMNVLGDTDRLSQVLSNLILNAAKFSPAGGVVSVGAERLPGARVRTRIRDRGAGIPESFRSRIFQPFSQAESGDNRSTTGTGLGLAISREIVARLGGTIGFDDVPGGGTEFWFDLPEAPVAQ